MPGPVKSAAGDITQAGDMVVYMAGYPAIYGKQPLYFKDPVFQARASIQAPKTSDKLRFVQEPQASEAITI
ncbi:Conjugal transfer protein TraG [compost metagenome]